MSKLNIYTLSYSTGTKITGAFPQVEVDFKVVSRLNDRTFEEISGKSFPEYPPSFKPFQLTKKAKLTNLLSCYELATRAGLFIDQKGRDFLENFELNKCQYYDLSFKDKKYYFLHIVNDESLIDFENSVFIEYDVPEVKINISSCADILHIRKKERKHIIPEVIALKKKVDLFRIPLDTDIYITEELGSAIQNEPLTGADIELCSPTIEWKCNLA